MLSDEEQKAVEILKEFLEKLEEFDFECQECGFNQQDEGKSLKILLNSIKKQSKEIEELRAENFELEFLDTGKKLKDKIKGKIEEYKEKCKNCNFKGKICEDFTKNYNCVIAICLNEFYSLLEKE